MSVSETLATVVFLHSLLNPSLHKLISSVFADYARTLKALGLKQGAVVFASKAGADGTDLLNELTGIRGASRGEEEQ